MKGIEPGETSPDLTPTLDKLLVWMLLETSARDTVADLVGKVSHTLESESLTCEGGSAQKVLFLRLLQSQVIIVTDAASVSRLRANVEPLRHASIKFDLPHSHNVEAQYEQLGGVIEFSALQDHNTGGIRSKMIAALP